MKFLKSLTAVNNKNKESMNKKNNIGKFIAFLNKQPIFLVLLAIAILYFYSMVVVPFVNGGLANLFEVWQVWQTFNAGMIAIIAALIGAFVAIEIEKSARQREAVKIRESRNNERAKLRAQKLAIDEQRARELIAARAFLPTALCLIHEYIEDISKKLLKTYGAKKKNNNINLQEYVAKIKSEIVPDGYQTAFKECITLALPDISKHLTYILVHLQVFSSRMESLNCDNLSDSYLREMLVDSIRFQIKLESLFDFARDGSPIIENHRNIENYYCRISRLSEYQIIIERGDDQTIDMYVDSAARRD